MIFEITPIFSVVYGFVVALLVSVALVTTKHLHGGLTLDTDEGVQKFHSAPTPRIGGVSLVIGFFAAWVVMDGEARYLFGLIGLAGLPALFFGLMEDITKKVGVKARLAATIASGMIFALLTGYTITSIDVWGIDYALAVPLVSFAFTAFAIGGAANAINLIDGFHGLASGTLLIILLAFALVGWRVEDTVLVSLALVMAAIVGGFFVVNFPFGKLFLGDAGAYFAGYFVAVLAVMLPARNPEVSPWISLLILSYPVTETVVSIVRRLMDEGAHPGEPDSAHLHHVVHRNWAHKVAHYFESPTSQNALTSLFMWILPLVTLASVAYCGLQSGSALAYLTICVVFYLASYRGISTGSAFGRKV